MLRKPLLCACLFMIFADIRVQAQTKFPYYYETIGNGDKTIDFVFGLYPASLNFFEGKDFLSYTSIRGAVINQAKGHDLKWSDYVVNILLKSGKLITNYVPASKDNDYICNYTVKTDSTHYQYFCFHSKFTSADIDKIWLVMSREEIISLLYEKNE